MTSRLRVSGMILFLALAVLAAACGGDDSSGEDDTTTTAGQETTTTTAPPTTTTAPTTTTTVAAEPVAGGDSNSPWCREARAAQEGGNQNPLDLDVFALTNPASAEQELTEFLTGVEMFEDLAPPEIEADVAIVAGAFRTFYETAEAAEFNLIAISEEDIAAFDNPALETAANNIDAYTTEVCGVDFDTPDDPGTGSDDPVATVLAALGLPAGLIPLDVQECVFNTLQAVNPEFIASIGPGFTPTEADIALLIETAAGCGFSLG